MTQIRKRETALNHPYRLNQNTPKLILQVLSMVKA